MTHIALAAFRALLRRVRGREPECRRDDMPLWRLDHRMRADVGLDRLEMPDEPTPPGGGRTRA